MGHNIGHASHLAFLQVSIVILLLLLIPIALSNHREGAFLGILVFVVIFFFPGYLLLTLLGGLPGGLRTVLSSIFGIVSITTTYDLFARASIDVYFPYAVVVLSAAGMMILVTLQIKNARLPSWWTTDGYETVLAGCVVALTIAPIYWRSGRFSQGEFVFYGPAGQDPLFHVTLMQRLLHHVPPDNFMVSGLRPTVYHYFGDLTLALILRAQHALHLGATDLFDVYYRCYPLFVYFLIGALAYRAGRQLLGSARGGILSVLLLLGTGGLGWFFGALQTAAHASQFAAMRAALFSSWTSWDGIDAILPLVHRPAYYHSLLICFAAINVLLRPERSRRDWLVAGLLLGLMAGFNFTLAATFGIATALGSLLLLLQHRRNQARDLVWLALFIFLGSLPVTAAMLLSGFHNLAPGFPFRGPNLEYPLTIWGVFLGRMMPVAFLPWASLILFPIVAYGVKLFGIGALVRSDLGEERHRGIAMVLGLVFALSFAIGTFFPYEGIGIVVAFLQPTVWVLGLFSLRPIDAWLERNRENWSPVALWAMLGLTWVQSLGAFNFSSKVAFGQDTAHALEDIRLAAAPDDVVAYLPSDLTATAIWGYPRKSTNFAIMAMTGLDGYFSSETYSKFHAVPGLSGRNPAEVLAQAERLYEQRRDDIGSFIKGDIMDAASARLANDQVRWIVVWGDALQRISSSTTPWRETRDIVVYRIYPLGNPMDPARTYLMQDPALRRERRVIDPAGEIQALLSVHERSRVLHLWKTKSPTLISSSINRYRDNRCRADPGLAGFVDYQDPHVRGEESLHLAVPLFDLRK
jgi:hypothetical protein